MKCLLQSAYGAGDLQRLLARIHLQYLEALGLEPVLDGLHILVAGPELLSELFGRQPFVKICACPACACLAAVAAGSASCCGLRFKTNCNRSSCISGEAAPRSLRAFANG